jgi:hypothetical protein
MATTIETGRPHEWPRFSPLRGLAWSFGTVVWMAAGLAGAALALFLALTVVVLATLSSIVLGLAAAAVKARRAFNPRRDRDLIEARRVGGHSWVAYGWDRDI